MNRYLFILREVVHEADVHHPVALLRPRSERFKVAQLAPANPAASIAECFCRRIGASQPDDFVTGLDELAHDGRSDKTGAPGEKDVHGLHHADTDLDRECANVRKSRPIVRNTRMVPLWPL